ncbi:MAG: NAD(P)H-hydrate dehydratase, partial [Erysipelotrichia bacterium]|nr:NAD(P)H-hydrate dehydratase [Erysipelotrichia bacterium]
KEAEAKFKEVNEAGINTVSIDINSGCESDSGFCDSDALRSDITLALDCWKPFHMLRKNHQRFKQAKLLSLNLPHPEHSIYQEMNEDLFFENFPRKEENAYKGTFGKAELIGGCWGMAGALSLNIIGAMTVGVSYLQVVLPEEIYPISGSQFIQPVFHPFGHETWHEVISGAMDSVRSVGFGSGCVFMDHKEDILDLILQECHCPVVLDAEALRLLKHNTYVLKFIKAPVILTPHIQEFADLVNQPISAVKDSPLPLALKFAKTYGVIVVLKSPNTIVVSPSGDIYINQTGNQALAQAGSGDLLTGIMTGLLSMTRDVFTAVCMAVWLHGHLADLGIQHHSHANFKLSSFPELMDELFMKHGF